MKKCLFTMFTGLVILASITGVTGCSAETSKFSSTSTVITSSLSSAKNGKTQAYTQKTKASSDLSPSTVYNWIQNRYEYYDRVYNKGNYSGDKYESQVFNDAAVHFGVSLSEVRDAYNNFRY